MTESTGRSSGSSYYASPAEEASARAWYALDDHKSTCRRCGDPQWQMCETGRGLQHHLWDCQETAYGTATIPNRQECRIDRPHDATECDGYHLDLSDT